MISTQLFESELVRLTFIDFEKDPKIEAEWSYDLDYVRALRGDKPPRLLLPKGIKEVREKQTKEAEDNRLRAYFAIRARQDDQLVGFLQIPHIHVSNHIGYLEILFGSPEWEEQFGDEVLRIGLRYVFDEFNFSRVGISYPEYATNSIRRLISIGFTQEVRRREVLFAHGRYWDQIRFGMLETEWRAAIQE